VEFAGDLLPKARAPKAKAPDEVEETGAPKKEEGGG
jgi:hypothetical protein